MKKDHVFDPKIDINGSIATSDGPLTFSVSTPGGRRIKMCVEGPMSLMQSMVNAFTKVQEMKSLATGQKK